MKYDIAVIGGGIVGLSSSWALSKRFPGKKIIVFEKEKKWSEHQTGRNSGVIHSGIYYKPGSFKAEFCRQGRLALIDFCKEYQIHHEICGKLIIAIEEEELPRLEALYQRGLQNGLAVKKLTPEQAHEIEPHIQCRAAIQVPETGIINYRDVTDRYATLIESNGGELLLGAEVVSIDFRHSAYILETTQGTFEAKYLVNCAGLQSDRIAQRAGAKTEAKIVPFRGEYYELVPEKRNQVKHLIYPVPNPDFPFLGVHFTRMTDGSVHAGPNAVLALQREGYSWKDISLPDLTDTLQFPGFWKLASKNWVEGGKEMWRSLSKKAFLKSLQRLIPTLQENDLHPSTAGVRAQALLPDGKLVDDFLFVTAPQAVHVLNAPSPAATCSLPIGEEVASRITDLR